MQIIIRYEVVNESTQNSAFVDDIGDAALMAFAIGERGESASVYRHSHHEQPSGDKDSVVKIRVLPGMAPHLRVLDIAARAGK